MIDVRRFEAEVSRPGKFEHEPAWVPYFWEQVLNGDGESHYPEADEDGEELGPEFIYFDVDAEEAEAFGLEVGDIVVLFEDTQGFVIGRLFRSHVAAIQFIYAAQ